MTPLEIVLLIIGIVILIVSIVFQTTTGKKDDGSFFEPADIMKQQKELEDKFVKNLEEHAERLLLDSDDALSRISNEKILAMNEFAETNLNKIDENHEHVVFLYNMLNNKDEEIKQTLARMEEAKNGMKETVEEVVRITRQLNSAVKKSNKNDDVVLSAGKAVQNTKMSVKNNARETQKEVSHKINGNDYKRSSQLMADEATGQMNLPEMMQSDNRNEEILKLHKNGKSVLQISKALNLGQGEVKLVIDLYGA